ncbi:MAG: hypothetical protein JXQ84_03855 [Rhodospirillaceae bacterium]|nr:hypothetical protein [Rhodospirillaceae bacterium]
MTPEEFRALLDTYGADLTRWPHARRQAAHKLLQDSGRARSDFADAQAFDSVLMQSEPTLSDTRRKNLVDSILDHLPDEVMSRQGRDMDVKSSAPRQPRATRGSPVAEAGISVLVRPLVGLWVGCLAFGILLGVGLYLGHQTLHVSAESDWVGTLTLFGMN